MSKAVKPKPVLGKCDTPGCQFRWCIVQHQKHDDQRRPVRKLCEMCWKR